MLVAITDPQSASEFQRLNKEESIKGLALPILMNSLKCEYRKDCCRFSGIGVKTSAILMRLL